MRKKQVEEESKTVEMVQEGKVHIVVQSGVSA